VLPEIELVSLGDLRPDPDNARLHNARNIAMIEDSLQEVGFARSGVIDEDNIILAGNGVTEAAGNVFGDVEAVVVSVDGNTPVYIRRTGLTAAQKKALAYYDNRTNELSRWNTDQLKADAEDGFDLKKLFYDEELKRLMNEGELKREQDEDRKPRESGRTCPACGYEF
jgi:hypothetical protein